MNTTPPPFSEQVRWCVEAAGKQRATMRRARGKVMRVERAVVFVTGLLRPGNGVRVGRCIQANHSEAANKTKRGVCALFLVLLVLTLGGTGDSVNNSSTAEARIVPAGYLSSTPTLSSEPNAGERNKEMATVTSRARFKVH